MKRVALVTGTRAEWGLLRRLAHLLDGSADVELQLLAAGAHLLAPARTIGEIDLPIAATIEMQRDGQTGRRADAAALGRGVSGFADAFARLRSEIVVVLGDRIEAFAAAAAGSVAGLPCVHIHSGDRAEGVADEAMRHAITKLASVHCCATEQSAERVRRMGEHPDRVIVTGSPAIDGLECIEPMDDAAFASLGCPELVVLHHPAGLDPAHERGFAEAIAAVAAEHRSVWLAPNHDPGREDIEAIRRWGAQAGRWRTSDHLPREAFVALLRRVGRDGGALVGSSSAGLIESAALRVPAVNIGPRQGGRERAPNVVDVSTPDAGELREAVGAARSTDTTALTHPYGDGRASERIADAVVAVDPADPSLRRKRCTY